MRMKGSGLLGNGIHNVELYDIACLSEVFMDRRVKLYLILE